MSNLCSWAEVLYCAVNIFGSFLSGHDLLKHGVAWWKKFGNCLGFEELGKVTLEFSIHQQFWEWSVDLGNYGGVAINWEEFQKYWGIVVNSLGVRSRLFRWFYVKIVVGDRSKVFIKFLGVVVVS